MNEHRRIGHRLWQLGRLLDGTRCDLAALDSPARESAIGSIYAAEANLADAMRALGIDPIDGRACPEPPGSFQR